MVYVQKLHCDTCGKNKSDVFYDDETDTAMCENCASKRDFATHVQSMETAFAGAWVLVERYIYKPEYCKAHGITVYLEVVSNVVTKHYLVDNQLNHSSPVHWNIPLVGRSAWGLGLREKGFRKLPAGLWVNSITGEQTAINPHGDK